MQKEIKINRPSVKFAKLSFLISLIILFGLNLIALSAQLSTIKKIKKISPAQDIEYKFAKLRNFFPAGTDYIGYYSCSNLKNPEEVKNMAHAQFSLAPIVLDENNLGHKYIIFNCAKESDSWEKIKEIKAIPVLRSEIGMILVIRPDKKQ
ncbi:MAG: hypothetical protein HQL27_03665 [Candidatus Omnitrophica bacterium]|nr:hypothetical protein [Candidatus Omnitrophota bacterium]